VPLFRRGEPLHERLAREGGLVFGDEQRELPGVQGVQRERRWDAVVAVETEGPAGAELAFVALPDGTLLTEEDVSVEGLRPFTEAIEAQVQAPYRAQAVRRGERIWAAAARSIDVVELRQEISGDELSLAVQGGERTLLVDGAPGFGSVGELERLAAARGLDAYVAQAERLDGDLWEVRLAAL
jgi:hypothetical protein